MHVMLKRAAASAIPALVGLAVSPATAMAAPHASRAVAGPAMGSREVHARLVQLPGSGTIHSHLAGTTRTAKTTADTYRLNGGGIARLARFIRVPGHAIGVGGTASGIIALGKNDTNIGNHLITTGGTGFDNSVGGAVGNGVGRTAGFSH